MLLIVSLLATPGVVKMTFCVSSEKNVTLMRELIGKAASQDGLVQDCSNSIANALGSLQSSLAIDLSIS